MKKSLILFVLIILVIATLVLWALNTDFQFNIQSILMISVLLLITIFAVFQLSSRLSSWFKNEPAEDELSAKIKRRASSMSFYVSIYTWLLLSFLNDDWKLEGHTIIGAGILLMAATFVIFWIYFKIRGIKDA